MTGSKKELLDTICAKDETDLFKEIVLEAWDRISFSQKVEMSDAAFAAFYLGMAMMRDISRYEMLPIKGRADA